MAIDDTSQMLGELISSVRTLNKSTNDIWEKLDEIEKALVTVSANEKAIAEMKPHVDEFRILKQRGLGVLGMIHISDIFQAYLSWPNDDGNLYSKK